VQLLSGDDLPAKIGLAFLLNSVGEDGYPHPCIVTPGEMYAASPSLIRLALYATSSATRNLRARSAATLSLALDGGAYYIKADAKEIPTPAAIDGLAVFALHPRHVLEDKEAGAEVTTGFRFTDSRGSIAVLEQWSKVLGTLRSMS
jgi:hypothetical protein